MKLSNFMETLSSLKDCEIFVKTSDGDRSRYAEPQVEMVEATVEVDGVPAGKLLILVIEAKD